MNRGYRGRLRYLRLLLLKLVAGLLNVYFPGKNLAGFTAEYGGEKLEGECNSERVV